MDASNANDFPNIRYIKQKSISSRKTYTAIIIRKRQPGMTDWTTSIVAIKWCMGRGVPKLGSSCVKSQKLSLISNVLSIFDVFDS